VCYVRAYIKKPIQQSHLPVQFQTIAYFFHHNQIARTTHLNWTLLVGHLGELHQFIARTVFVRI
jgi:hypothetical protein